MAIKTAGKRINGNQDVKRRLHFPPNHSCMSSFFKFCCCYRRTYWRKTLRTYDIKAYRLFETKGPYQMAIDLGLTQPEITKYYSGYRILKGLDDLTFLYDTLGHKSITQLKSLHKALTRHGITLAQYAIFIGKANNIDNLILEEEKLIRRI